MHASSNRFTMKKSRQSVWVAFAAISYAAIWHLAVQAQDAGPNMVQVQSKCSYTETKTGWWGGATTPLDYRIEEGSKFVRKGDDDGAPSFCGDAKLHAIPFGWIPANLCIATADGKLVAAPESKKTVQSDCIVTDPERMGTPYQDADFQQYLGKGSANLRGQAFLRTVGGDVKTCAGAKVVLVPGNAYGDEMIAKERANLTAKADPKFIAQIRDTICDAQGNFSFASVPAGHWYVSTAVTWGVPHIEQPDERVGPITALILGIAPPSETDQQGGELIQAVTLQAGDNQAFLTARDLR